MVGIAWVVRAGEAKAADLMRGYAPHRLVAGLYGFSVQYEPGKTVEDLAAAGQFPNPQISYADEAILASALGTIGYRMQLVRSPGKGAHHTFAVFYDATGVLQTSLPLLVAQRLEGTFQRMPNPHRVPRRQP